MAPKRCIRSAGGDAKKTRKMLTIKEKIELLDMLKAGRSNVDVDRHYGINKSTVRYIRKDEKKIRQTSQITFNNAAKRMVTPRNKRLMKMEAALSVWVQDCRKKSIALDTNTIRTKAQQLYNRLEDTEGGDADEGNPDEGAGDSEDPQPSTSSASSAPATFTSSKGWFYKFQRRYGLKSVSLHGEAASADTGAAENFVRRTFKDLIAEGGYLPEQVFNMDETGLFWKRMPSRTFLMQDEAKAPGFKAMKDRVTLIMCGNAAGFLLKPGLIYKSRNPRALKNRNKNALPVYWMHNPKAWITKPLTRDWFHQCFIPQVQVYLAAKGLDFKVLLLMDNAGGHDDLAHEHDVVEVEFLPPNTTSLIQPMDQGIIRAFKALYTRNSLASIVEAMDADENFTLKAYWRQYTIASCLKNIQSALMDMKSQTMNACWRKLWPEVVNYHRGFAPEEIQDAAVQNSVKLAQALGGEGFVDMTPEEVNGLLDEHGLPLTDGDLEELTKSASEEEEEEVEAEEAEEEEDVGLTLERLAEVNRTAAHLQRMVELWDPNMTRSIHFKASLDNTIAPYRAMLAKQKKTRQQLPITMFVTKTKRSATTSPAASIVDMVIEEDPDLS
ncbi:homocysteine-responsive endoplasmic reticulum-resident ubiquitin-like domain member 2 protein isoform X1 [Erythrolamprus reginae]|uniref:homocysteine-responsive endoplasmic reticulum-resident ubiquitin-like domain member 2 protein isoform X1 n=2 Tax=Erythrolamprus reginae TaxID=121349 RepID=UPI00396C4FF9